MNYIHNKYATWYFAIIKDAKLNPRTGYTEKHHAIPKSLGGTDDPDNIVCLTGREHFICHRLLPKMLSGSDKRKMCLAAFSLAHWRNGQRTTDFKVSARTYEKLKEEYAATKRGPRSEETKRKMSEAAKKRGPRILSDAHKAAISAGHKGKKMDPTVHAKMLAGIKKKREEQKLALDLNS